MIFIGTLILSALTISLCAGYFSIYGLASIFASSFWPVVSMGIVLEIGKLVSASYIYRYWETTSFLLKTYLISAICVLMLITSIGIFGFLSASYQEDSIPLKEIEKTIQLLSTEKSELLFRKRQIDKDISSLPSNYVRGRQKLMKSYAPELSKINTRLDIITIDLSDITKSQLQIQSHTGPIIYIAKVFGKDVDDAIMYMIFALIFVFDPLAIILVICSNIAIRQYKQPKLPASTELDVDSQSAIDQVISKKKIINSVRNQLN